MNENLLMLLKITFSILYIYVIGRLLWQYFFIYTAYMFNQKVYWNKNVEKPKLCVYSIFIPASFLFYKALIKSYHLTSLVILRQCIYFSAGVILIFFCHYTWTQKFELWLIPKITKVISEKSIKRNVFEIEESFLKQLYERFRIRGFIDEDVSYNNFHKVIIFEENDPKVKVDFNLKGTEFKHFFDLLQNISKQKVDFKPFIEKNNMIYNSKAKRYNYNTLKDYGKSNSKIAEIIDDIFNEIS